MSYVVFPRPDGGVSVVHPAPGVSAADAAARAVATGTVPNVPHVVVTSLPSRRWRASWRLANGAVTVRLAGARAVRQLELAEQQRWKVLVLSDLIAAAEDAGKSTAALRARRKAVRDYDAAAACAGAASLEELEALAPPD